MNDGLFLHATYAETRKPLPLASPLPGWCYVSPAWYQREIDSIFRGPNAEWLCVGRIDQVPNPGDFYTIDLLDQPLIIVRDQKHQVHVLSAVCRHRGSVITAGEGNCKAFVCPYHSWCYD